ncbi:SDR family NAD(P)-dependent oxidoreductase [Streptomyces sp. N2-109]|uniref:SDR family NAD(P)-dependent oxidoreductase n=1 Tax=Streptomyces gossypii TaxID=2883101 RepID=A0ABT2JU75_9ACTN|nr:SDR family NAD(P)-dependent oxidoreductase [Streptomyces gossypii]MCT2591447.1 SDR family NAD(P)-dependent oxidoreductase [Streptomyces gossypii]
MPCCGDVWGVPPTTDDGHDHERIDVVVSNAGFGDFGTAEDLTDEQVEQAIATNLTGSIQLARRAVPHLREQGGGVLVQLYGRRPVRRCPPHHRGGAVRRPGADSV